MTEVVAVPDVRPPRVLLELMFERTCIYSLRFAPVQALASPGPIFLRLDTRGTSCANWKWCIIRFSSLCKVSKSFITLRYLPTWHAFETCHAHPHSCTTQAIGLQVINWPETREIVFNFWTRYHGAYIPHLLNDTEYHAKWPLVLVLDRPLRFHILFFVQSDGPSFTNDVQEMATP